MSCKRFLGAASAALMIVIAVTLVLAPAAGAASKYKVLHAFHGSDGSDPYGGLIVDVAGNLYGTTNAGGAHGLGTAFKLTPNADGSWTESVLHSFNQSDGANPQAGLIFDAAGNLYGTTQEGGDLSQCSPYGCGTVFKLAPNADGSWTESVLYSFKGINFSYPNGLIFDAAGNLYGTTYTGGASGAGNVFKLTPNADGSWTESVLHSFHNNDAGGAGPLAGLIFDAAGNLYGTTVFGGDLRSQLCGSLGCGVVFKLTPNANGSWTESVLHSFNGRDGVGPVGDLTFDPAGNLYGPTANGGTDQFGTVFKLTPNADGSWTESVLHRFQGNPADTPRAGLIFDGAGNLYGTASSARSENDGAVFKLSPNQDGGWTYSLIHVFQGKPALSPGFSGLVLGSAGTLYGTTEGCGTGCEGVVYQITP
jgi:uncharacterized repeat protein (TIGR03803 family)